VDVAVKKESKYLCSARLTAHQALWQHQRKQRREKKHLQPSPDKQQNGHSGHDTGQMESMAKYSEAVVSTGEETKGGGDEMELSLAESFLLGKIQCCADVYPGSITDPGLTRFRILDPGSGSAPKNLSIFNPKN
jgi:hypothetical protein